ncbi:MAG: histidinol dehydrogenase, partial [Treponema sp.]|nr:histidinol dehydrogenase [Treponema sp.]
MRVICGGEFNQHWKAQTILDDDIETERVVREIVGAVRAQGDAAVRKFASKFDRASPFELEVPFSQAAHALAELRENDPVLVEALEFAAQNIIRFSMKQKEQFTDFEFEMACGLFTGQKVIPVQRAAVYIPAGRFPLFSSVLMCMIPALCAGVEEVILTSPPAEDGFPDMKILAAAAIAAKVLGSEKKVRIFVMGGAQAIAALAFGTESVPRVDVITGPGNKYVA